MRALLVVALAAFLSAPAAGQGIELINVYDSMGKPPKGAQLDFGFGAIARFGGKTYLFDGGANADVLRKNLQAMGIAVGSIDVVVGSHQHHDHIGGLDYIIERNPEVQVYLPKDFGLGAETALKLSKGDKKLAKDMEPADCHLGDCSLTEVPIRSSGRFRKASKLTWVDEDTEIAEGVKIVFTEAKKEKFPEFSLAFATAEGTVLLVGCAHSGVATIARATKKAMGGDTALVAGGFHFAPLASSKIRTIVGKMKKAGVKGVAPAHCTGYAGHKQLKKSFKDGYLPFGLGWRIGG